MKDIQIYKIANMKISGYIHGLIAVCSKYGDMYKNASGKMGQLAGRTLVLSLLVLLSGCGSSPVGYTPSPHDLVFDSLAGKWDEAVPLGNGQVGALVWQKGDRLRFSLDRVDLWDLRPTEGMTWDKPVYDWICEQWQNNTYGTVQELLDEPYGRLPGAEQDSRRGARIPYGRLGGGRLRAALCPKCRLQGMVAFGQDAGGLCSVRRPVRLVPLHGYRQPAPGDRRARLCAGRSIGRGRRPLGTGAPYARLSAGCRSHERPHDHLCATGMERVPVCDCRDVEKTRGGIEGVWSVQSTYGGNSVKNIASDVRETLGEGYADAYKVHRDWWQRFWDKSAVSLPDSVLEKQWYLEQYKFGSAARADMPPITLQAVWTADNGSCRPERGFSPRPEYAIELLAGIRGQPPGRGDRFHELAVESSRRFPTLYGRIFRAWRTECAGGDDARRRTDGRMVPVFDVADRFGVARTPFLPALAL